MLSKQINDLINYNRFRIITITLIAFILASPYAEESFIGRSLMGLLTIAIIISIAFTVLRKTTTFMVVCFVGTALIISYLIFLITGDFVADFVSNFLLIVIYIIAIFVIFAKVLQRGDITGDTIFAAISVYILLGLMYGCVYFLIELIHPGSFKFSHLAPPSHFTYRYDLAYFSFVVLTTVGLGDIAPLSGYAKSIVILEGITGIFYIAILVSRLVNGLERRDFERKLKSIRAKSNRKKENIP